MSDTITIRVTKTASGYFAVLGEDQVIHGAGSTPAKAVLRLMAAAPDKFTNETMRPYSVTAEALTANAEYL